MYLSNSSPLRRFPYILSGLLLVAARKCRTGSLGLGTIPFLDSPGLAAPAEWLMVRNAWLLLASGGVVRREANARTGRLGTSGIDLDWDV